MEDVEHDYHTRMCILEDEGSEARTRTYAHVLGEWWGLESKYNILEWETLAWIIHDGYMQDRR